MTDLTLNQSLNQNSPTKKQLYSNLTKSILSKYSGSNINVSALLEGQNRQQYLNEMVKKLNTQINDKILDLDNKLDDVLERHEKDFLVAYRFHMLRVQKELYEMKEKAKLNELSVQQEQKILRLQQEVIQIRQKCMENKFLSDSQEKMISKLNEKKNDLDDDRKFLEFELRNCKKQNQMLKEAISQSQNQHELLEQQNVETNEYLSQYQKSIIEKQNSLMKQSIAENQTQQTTARHHSIISQIDNILVTNQNSILEVSEPEQTLYNQQSKKDKANQEQDKEKQSNQDSRQTNTLIAQEQVTKLSKRFKDGQGPQDLQDYKKYKARFTNFMYDTICENNDRNVIANKVEQYFKEDVQRRLDLIDYLRAKVKEQKLINQQKQRKAVEQSRLNIPTQESEELVHSFKESIEKVLQNKRDSLNQPQLTIDNLQNAEKKQVIETFVGNDKTLSHLLEFISNKLLDMQHQSQDEVDNNNNRSTNLSQIKAKSKQQSQLSQLSKNNQQSKMSVKLQPQLDNSTQQNHQSQKLTQSNKQQYQAITSKKIEPPSVYFESIGKNTQKYLRGQQSPSKFSYYSLQSKQ